MIVLEQILIVSSAEKIAASLSGLIGRDSKITAVSNGGEARRLLSSCEFDIVIVNAPLSDEFGHDLAVWISEISFSGILMLAKAEQADMIWDRVCDHGISVLGKPLSRKLFLGTLRTIRAYRSRLMKLQKKNKLLVTQLDTFKIVSRAKLLLMEQMKMSENQAHSYIEKQAMDLRVPKREIAEGILKTYEN
jgi:AmiR/NasT family two-component response regulator